MQPFTAFAVYMVMWWTMIFVVLPWGVRTEHRPGVGLDRGSPRQPHLLTKALWTTIITSILWIGFYIINRYDLISLRQIFGR